MAWFVKSLLITLPLNFARPIPIVLHADQQRRLFPDKGADTWKILVNGAKNKEFCFIHFQ